MNDGDSWRAKRRRTVQDKIRTMLDYVRTRSSSMSSASSKSHASSDSQSENDAISSASSLELARTDFMASSNELLSSTSNESSDGSDLEYIDVIEHLDSNVSTNSDASTVSSGAINELENILADTKDTRNDQSLHDKLQAWAVNRGITHAAIRELLRVLHRYHPELPLDPRTLLGTNSVNDLLSIDGGGSYYHFGVADGVEKWLNEMEYAEKDIYLQFNVDGLPIHKSSKAQLWPMLAMVKIPGVKCKSFMCGLYMGKQKPPVNVLDTFVSEMKQLMEHGLVHSKGHFAIHIDSFVCDTLACCLIKQTKLYSGYQGCNHCCQPGVYEGRMTFPEIGQAPRTDLSFQERDHAQHHTGESPIEDLGIGMVSKFPLDYMHCCLLGCMKKILGIWL